MTFADLLRQDPIDMDAVEAHLDALDDATRVTEVQAVPGGLQRKLFAAAQGRGKLDNDYFVPPDVAPRAWVRHFGRNSLPVFSLFEKRFVRPYADATHLWGFNFGPTMGLVGPGHYVLRDGPDAGEMYVDYTSLPDEAVEGAPALASNERGISRFVYGFMKDTLRRVSRHVTIGRAVRHGKDTPNYFLLCRER